MEEIYGVLLLLGSSQSVGLESRGSGCGGRVLAARLGKRGGSKNLIKFKSVFPSSAYLVDPLTDRI